MPSPRHAPGRMARSALRRDGKHRPAGARAFATDRRRRQHAWMRRASDRWPIAAERHRTRAPSVRLSLTDRCDLACVYCRPSRNDGYLEKRLDDDAWKAMVRALVAAGVRRVRITGRRAAAPPARRRARRVRRVARRRRPGAHDERDRASAELARPLRRPASGASRSRSTRWAGALLAHHPRRAPRAGPRGGGRRARSGLRRGEDEHRRPSRRERRRASGPGRAGPGRGGVVPRFIELMRVGEGARSPADNRWSAGPRCARASLHLLADSRRDARTPSGVRRATCGPPRRRRCASASSRHHRHVLRRVRSPARRLRRHAPPLPGDQRRRPHSRASRSRRRAGLSPAHRGSLGAQARRPDVEGMHRVVRRRRLDARDRG